jgi:excisionase family DNA binding protein
MRYDNGHKKLAYSINEACRASSLGRTSLYAHIAAGRLQSVKVGGRTLIPAASLEALVAGAHSGQTPHGEA